MKMAGIASKTSDLYLDPFTTGSSDVVEIGILLPANHAADLVRVAKDRRESVGHMIRKLIDAELATVRMSG